MNESKLQKIGVYELMQVLHELHNMGYQKLRWISYMAPSGCSLRCHITTQDHIIANQEIDWQKADEVFASSVGAMTTGEGIQSLVRLFIEENPRLIEIGKGEDADYVDWFEKLLSFAAKGQTPVFYGEFWSIPKGFIQVGKSIMLTPPSTMRLISWNIDGIKAHFDALKNIVSEYSPEIICLQKVKDIKDSPEFKLEGYYRECFSTPYAGIATYVKNSIPCQFEKPENPEFSGHLLKTEILYPPFTLYNIYTPYSNPKIEGAIKHRKKFDESLKRIVCTTPDRQILCGDMNMVATSRDCWDGKYQRNQANFHDWERCYFEQLLKEGHLIDTYRTFHPFTKEFTYFFRNDSIVRANNQGYRIDYFLASRSFEPQIVKAEIIKECSVSTNNPILLEIKY